MSSLHPRFISPPAADGIGRQTKRPNEKRYQSTSNLASTLSTRFHHIRREAKTIFGVERCRWVYPLYILNPATTTTTTTITTITTITAITTITTITILQHSPLLPPQSLIAPRTPSPPFSPLNHHNSPLIIIIGSIICTEYSHTNSRIEIRFANVGGKNKQTAFQDNMGFSMAALSFEGTTHPSYPHLLPSSHLPLPTPLPLSYPPPPLPFLLPTPSPPQAPFLPRTLKKRTKKKRWLDAPEKLKKQVGEPHYHILTHLPFLILFICCFNILTLTYTALPYPTLLIYLSF